MPMSIHSPLLDRVDAGRRLGETLRARPLERPIIVLGLPRGGIPVAAVVAEMLDAPLDVCVVRKLGVPGHEELAFGAIASGGARVFNDDVIGALRLSADVMHHVILHEQRELSRREVAFRGSRAFPDIGNHTVIVVDDGAATGASMLAALRALRLLRPRRLIAAVPCASIEAARTLNEAADECVCLMTPEPFYGVGAWYRDFAPTADQTVRDLLIDARHRYEEPELIAGQRRN
jgi:putative phosphoribosyl transferase